MKFQITVEIFNEKKNRNVTTKDLKPFGTISFVKGLTKALKKSIKASCWPFDAKIHVSVLDKPKQKQS
jgi:hypothetical protein